MVSIQRNGFDSAQWGVDPPDADPLRPEVTVCRIVSVSHTS
jgi:hypothetical protein